MHPLNPHALQRKDFIKMAALGSIGLYLTGCNTNSNHNPTPEKQPANAPRPQNTVAAKTVSSNDVIFYTKTDATYETLRHGFNKRINKYPAIIALCKTPEGVAAALDKATKSGLPVAIKSGGHCTEGFSVNDGGMVINLSQLNQLQLLDGGIVQAGPGAKLAQLYDTLFPQNRLVPAGACGSVGLGGLALGGGYGFFSREYGLNCDHLVQVNMVDAIGNLHIAKEGDELLWACKGGGNGNFGVITQLHFKSHVAPVNFTSHRFRQFKADAAKAQELMEQWFTITANLPVTCFSAYVLNQKTVYMLLTNSGPETQEVKTATAALTALVEQTHLGKPQPTAQALKAYYGASEPMYFRNSSAGLYTGYDEIKSFIPQVINKVMQTPGMLFQLGTLGGNIDNKDLEKASAFAHRSRHFISELQTYWQQPGQEIKLKASFAEIQDIFSANSITAQYCNYPYLGFKDAPHAYYGNNYTRLQAIKKQYDPDNLIRSKQSIKLS